VSAAATVRCHVGLGSNLDDPPRHIEDAIEALKRLPGCTLVDVSPLYASAPMGPPDQPDYCNAVAALDTALAPLELLGELQALEAAHGRVRDRHWDARTLDLDLLLYGNLIMDSALLTLPHPGLSSRDFVLYPLADVAPPDLPIPGLGRLDELLARCPKTHLKPAP
jgi:2-amino-4-hydroxy-6-hydroxymethyldihydropteridine diphosphokinase